MDCNCSYQLLSKVSGRRAIDLPAMTDAMLYEIKLLLVLHIILHTPLCYHAGVVMKERTLKSMNGVKIFSRL